MRHGLIFALMGASLLPACAGSSPEAETEMATVSGTVTYLERRAMPPEAVVTVRLQDVSRADVPAILMGEQRITMAGRQVPIPYEISYDPATIDPRMTYTVSARIEIGDRLLMISDTAYRVITRDAPTRDVEIRVITVAR